MPVGEDSWNLSFDRRRNYNLSLPATFSEDDWELPTRVINAVRGVLDPEPVTEVLPITPRLDVEATQPIAPLFRPGLKL